MGAEQKYSVLMAVYAKEKPENLRESMDSIRNQTIQTDDFVLVCDGPLTEELDEVICEKKKQMGDALRVIRLKNNLGTGRALNKGIKSCRHERILRMDSDDISYPNRCERQLQVFRDHPEISVTSGIVEEFETDPAQVLSRRVPPETAEEIREFAKKRNPFNHPAVMYLKSAVEQSGGYQDFYLLEDYYLWIRMLDHGFIGYNLQEPILKMRAGSAMYHRRSGIRYAVSQAKLFLYMKEIGWINTGACVQSIVIRSISSVLPNIVRRSMFKKILRK